MASEPLPVKRRRHAGLPVYSSDAETLAAASADQARPSTVWHSGNTKGATIGKDHVHNLEQQLAAVKRLQQVYQIEYCALFEELRAQHQQFTQVKSGEVWKAGFGPNGQQPSPPPPALQQGDETPSPMVYDDGRVLKQEPLMASPFHYAAQQQRQPPSSGEGTPDTGPELELHPQEHLQNLHQNTELLAEPPLPQAQAMPCRPMSLSGSLPPQLHNPAQTGAQFAVLPAATGIMQLDSACSVSRSKQALLLPPPKQPQQLVQHQGTSGIMGPGCMDGGMARAVSSGALSLGDWQPVTAPSTTLQCPLGAGQGPHAQLCPARQAGPGLGSAVAAAATAAAGGDTSDMLAERRAAGNMPHLGSTMEPLEGAVERNSDRLPFGAPLDPYADVTGLEMGASILQAHGDQASFSDAEEQVLAEDTGVRARPMDEQLCRWRGRLLSVAGDVVAMEAAASAASDHEMDSLGALAALCGRTGRYLVCHTAVTLGRSASGKGECDVDLAMEAAPGSDTSAGKVSRRQAQLSLDVAHGVFQLLNLGRRKLHVNGMTVGQFQSIPLPHLSLLEIGGVRLLFLVNHAAVARVQRRTKKLVF